MKRLDIEHKNVSNELARTEHAFSEKMEDVTGGGHLRKLKTRLFKLRQQVEELTRTEGILYQTLFSCAGMRQGKHHLYDEIMPEQLSPTQRDSQVTRAGGGAPEDEGLRDEDFD